MSKKITAKKTAPKKKPVAPKDQSPYEIAAAKAISLNQKSAAYAAAIAVIEVLLNQAKKTNASPELQVFLETALKNAKDGTGQDGGVAASDVPDPGPRAK